MNSKTRNRITKNFEEDVKLSEKLHLFKVFGYKEEVLLSLKDKIILEEKDILFIYFESVEYFVLITEQNFFYRLVSAPTEI